MSELSAPPRELLSPRVRAALWLCFGLWLLWQAVFQGAGSSYVSELNGQVADATHNSYIAGEADYSLSRTLGVWVSAFLTLSVFSFLYRDNVFYKVTEAVFVGLSAGYWMVVGFWTVIVPNLLGRIWPGTIQQLFIPGLSPIRDEDWWMYLIPLVLGNMLMMRLSPRGAWIARWPLAFIIGSTAGLRLVAFLQADFLVQISSTIKPVLVFDPLPVDPAQAAAAATLPEQFMLWKSVENLLIVVCVLSTLVYFFFSIEHTGVVGRISRVGVWVLMVTFGSAFGYTVMGRIALLASRFEFLFDDWLWLIDPAARRLGM